MRKTKFPVGIAQVTRAPLSDHIRLDFKIIAGFALHRHDDDQWQDKNGCRVRPNSFRESLWHKGTTYGRGEQRHLNQTQQPDT